MNADDRLSLDPLGRVEGGNRIVEGSHVADVCPQPTNPDPLDELTQFPDSHRFFCLVGVFFLDFLVLIATAARTRSFSAAVLM